MDKMEFDVFLGRLRAMEEEFATHVRWLREWADEMKGHCDDEREVMVDA